MAIAVSTAVFDRQLVAALITTKAPDEAKRPPSGTIFNRMESQ